MQASPPKEKPNSSPAATFLAGGLLALSPIPGGNVAGALMCMSSAYRMIQTKQSPIAATTALLSEVWNGFAECWSEPAEQGLQLSQEIVTNAKQQLPWTQILETEAVEQLNRNTDWLKPILEMDVSTKRVYHFGVCGEPGDGKTQLLLMAVNSFLTKYPQGKVLIHDLDFENNNEPDRPAWFGLEIGKHVFTETSDVQVFGDAIHHEFNKRSKPCNHEPMLIVIDEFNNLMGELSDAQRDDLIALLTRVKNRGGKRGMQLAIATQKLAVGELKINRAFITSLDWIVLQRATLKKWVTDNLGLVDETLAEFRDCMRQIKRMGRVDGVRPCITLMTDEVTLRAVPGAASLPESVTLVTPESKGEQWINNLLEMFPEILEDVEKGAYESLRALTENEDFKVIVKDFDGSSIQRKSTDFRYVALKNWWDSLDSQKNTP
ncbi:MAG: hypothetical protein AAF151_14615 [Cyanobacteria bacterium J06656_5]